MQRENFKDLLSLLAVVLPLVGIVAISVVAIVGNLPLWTIPICGVMMILHCCVCSKCCKNDRCKAGNVNITSSPTQYAEYQNTNVIAMDIQEPAVIQLRQPSNLSKYNLPSGAGGKSNTTELTNPSYPPPYVNVSTGLPPLTKDDIPNILPPSYHDVVSNSKCQETL